MGHELARLIPLALAAAINPTGILVLVALLATAKRAAATLAIGFSLAFIVFGAVVLAFGLRLSGGHSTASAVVDLVAAALILYLGVRSFAKQRRAGRGAADAEKYGEAAGTHKKKRRLGAAGGFAAGLALAASDFSSIIPYAVALKDLSISGLGAADVALADAVFLAIMLAPMVVPVALTYAAPATADKLLKPVDRTLTRHGQTIIGVVCVVLAAYLAIKGVCGL
jgi:threonine/homoserine/homoserine lactone efflux protein